MTNTSPLQLLDTPASPLAGPDRRAHERHASTSRLYAIDLEDGQPLGDVHDVSLGGMRLYLRKPLRRGAVLRLLLVPQGLPGTPPTLELRARTIWIHRIDRDASTYAGFVFLDPTPATQQLLNQLFAALKGPRAA